MSNLLRHALLDLIWASSLDALRNAYRKLEAEPLTAHEREVAANLMNELVHIMVKKPLLSIIGKVPMEGQDDSNPFDDEVPFK